MAYVQLDFFTSFKDIQPEVPIMFILFQMLRPWFVHRLTQWNTCCHYHMDLKELLLAMNDMWRQRKGVHDRCSYVCSKVCNTQEHEGMQLTNTIRCSTNLVLFSGLTQMWTSMLHLKPILSLWHSKNCLEVLFLECGVDILKST